MLQAWDFTPTVLGYIANVRGVITGLGRDASARVHLHQAASPLDESCGWMRRSAALASERLTSGAGGGYAVQQPARDGSTMSWGTVETPAVPATVTAGTPVEVAVAVSPIRPGHAVTVDYRVDGGPLRQVTASPGTRARNVNARLFRASIPAHAQGRVSFLPVLRLAGQPLTPRLGESGTALEYEIPAGAPPSGEAAAPDASATTGQPQWAWEASYLGSLSAQLRKEKVGVTPDGLRIDWHVMHGSFAGPGIELNVLPGAADWMRIRKDGIGIVNVQVCLESRDGERLYGAYGGIADLGPDGYERALRDDFDAVLPVVVTPTYATSVARLQWLNRAQCLGVGRMNMPALQVEFDVHLVRAGDRLGVSAAGRNGVSGAGGHPSAAPQSLYARMGGYDVLAAVADDFITSISSDPQLGRLFVGGYPPERMNAVRQHVVEFLCSITGGSCFYLGRDMKTTHRGMGITGADWEIGLRRVIAALTKSRVAAPEQAEFVRIIQGLRSTIVERP